MARILADREIKRLIGSALIHAEKKYVNPNGIELRLGKQVCFHSTGEEKELKPGSFLKVNPGETVVITSLERIDFTQETVQTLYPSSMLMGFITPTTTMMREGISQVATKIDAGFRGILNWGLRNGSVRDLIIGYGEPIFKLTIFLLDEKEAPDIPYGVRDGDKYQDSKGVTRSKRHIPADIPKDKIVSSSFDKLDPKKQLREAGYPFDHIGRELVDLHGKFEVVSKDVLLLKEEFHKRTDELSAKIATETTTLSEKMDEFRQSFFERVEAIFTQKFMRVVGCVIGAISIMYAGVRFLEARNVGHNTLAFVAIIVGLLVFLVTYLVTRAKN